MKADPVCYVASTYRGKSSKKNDLYEIYEFICPYVSAEEMPLGGILCLFLGLLIPFKG